MKKQLLTLYKLSLLVLFLQSMNAWFFWKTLIVTMPFVTFVSVLLWGLLQKDKSTFSFQRKMIFPILLLIVFELYLALSGNINSLIISGMRIIIFSVLLFCSNNVKTDILRFITKSVALILLVSMAAWIVRLSGINLPYFEATFGEDQYSYRNYYFFLLDQRQVYFLLPRFSSIFLEPGHLGMIASLLLFANKFELRRKEVLIIFIAILMTFSLAAYVLLMISGVIFLIIHTRKVIRNLFIAGVTTLVLITFFSTYNDGDNAVNNFILLRLQIEDGDLAGNNRFSEELDDYYSQIMKSDKNMFGIGTQEYIQQRILNSAGYKVYLIQYGIIGTLVTFLFYLSLMRLRKSKLTYFFLLVYILCFLQRAYPHWDVEILIFIISLPYLASYVKKTNKQEVLSDTNI